MVLGVQWLKTLGSIMIDYNTLSMKFFHEGHLVEFQGDTDLVSVLLTPPQLR